jgi:SAM-dependent methyltransferase
MRSAAQAFWIEEGEHHIKPNVGREGFDMGAALLEALGSFGRVLDIGCGDGEMAAVFEPHEYVGVDINPTVIAIARDRLPHHDFFLRDSGNDLPAADTAFFCNVLLHVPDDEIRDCLAAAAAGRKRIVIAEMMDRRWRRNGNPPVSNRNPEDYDNIMRSLGFEKRQCIGRICQRYNSRPWTDIASPLFTLLTYEGEDKWHSSLN